MDEVKDKAQTGVSEYERILYRYLPVRYTREPLSDEQVMGLVNLTASNMEEDATSTLSGITSQDHLPEPGRLAAIRLRQRQQRDHRGPR